MQIQCSYSWSIANGPLWAIDWHPNLDILAVSGSNSTIQLFSVHFSTNKSRVTPVPDTFPSIHLPSFPLTSKPVRSDVSLVPFFSKVFQTRTIRQLKWNHSGSMIGAASFGGQCPIFSFHPPHQVLVSLSKPTNSDTDSNTVEKTSTLLETSQKEPQVTLLGFSSSESDNDGGEKESLHFPFSSPSSANPTKAKLADESIIPIFTQVAMLDGHKNEIKSLSWAKDDSSLVTVGRDQSIWIWGHESDEFEDPDDEDEGFPLGFECLDVVTSFSKDVKRVAWHPKKSMFATANFDSIVRLFTPITEEEWTLDASLLGHSDIIWSIIWDHQGKRLFSCDSRGTCIVWKEKPNFSSGGGDVSKTKTNPWVQETHIDISGSITAISLNCDDSLIAMSTDDKKLHVYDLQEDAMQSLSFSHLETISLNSCLNDIAWHPSKPNYIASCCDDGGVQVFYVDF